VLQYCLINVDLWIKKEGDGSAGKQLFCGYAELNTFFVANWIKADGTVPGRLSWLGHALCISS